MKNEKNKNTECNYEFGVTDKRPFATLIKDGEKKCWNNAWYPFRIEDYQNALYIFNAKEEKDNLDIVIYKNISYNLQYLQFLEKELDELAVSSVVRSILIKTYVITCVSIIEGLFSYILKLHGKWKPTSRKRIINYEKNGISLDDRKLIIKTEIFKVLTKAEIEENNEFPILSLTCILDKMNRIYKNLNIDPQINDELENLQELRNKIHLENTSIKSHTDHDYNTFTDKIKYEAGYILHTILTSSSITKSPEYFDFLTPNVKAHNSSKGEKTSL